MNKLLQFFIIFSGTCCCWMAHSRIIIESSLASEIIYVTQKRVHLTLQTTCELLQQFIVRNSKLMCSF
jgi:hypothetical protein